MYTAPRLATIPRQGNKRVPVLRLHNVRVRYNAPIDEITRAAFAKLRGARIDLTGLRVVRRSIDTRSKPRILWSLAVEFEGDPDLISHLPQNEASVVEPVSEPLLVPGDEPFSARPVIVGSGPAGLFAALTLAQRGYEPIVVERGREIPNRNTDVSHLMSEGRLDPESNFLFGLGGAGAYSDGKLMTRIGDSRVRWVLETFAGCGAPEAILIDARPHIGSDLLPGVVTNLRHKIEALGGGFRFNSRVARLELDSAGGITGAIFSDGVTLAAGVVVLAAGAWADDLVESLFSQGIAIEPKPFQIGVRIEHPQGVIDNGVYGQPRGDLPAAEYIMSCPPERGKRGVATFCMCPGGIIVPAICREGRLSTNAMSRSARDGKFANAALVVTVAPEDLKSKEPLAGLHFQRDLERAAYDISKSYRAPSQTVEDFLSDSKSESLPESSYPLSLVPVNLKTLLPRFLSDALRNALLHFDRKIAGFIRHGLLVGVEARVSSSIRIVRNEETFESISTGRLYPVGEGAGYAGGIVSSAVDGIRAAESIVSRFAAFSLRA